MCLLGLKWCPSNLASPHSDRLSKVGLRVFGREHVWLVACFLSHVPKGAENAFRFGYQGKRLGTDKQLYLLTPDKGFDWPHNHRNDEPRPAQIFIEPPIQLVHDKRPNETLPPHILPVFVAFATFLQEIAYTISNAQEYN